MFKMISVKEDHSESLKAQKYSNSSILSKKRDHSLSTSSSPKIGTQKATFPSLPDTNNSPSLTSKSMERFKNFGLTTA